MGFPGDTSSKESPAIAGGLRDAVLIPGSGRSLGEGHGNPHQYSCLENHIAREVWWAIGSKSQTGLKRFSMHTLTM